MHLSAGPAGFCDPENITTGIASVKGDSIGYMPHNTDKRSPASRANPVPAPVRRALRDVAGNVVAWRKLRGLTQAQLADRSGVSRDTLIRFERGDGGVSVENLLRVLRALGILDSLPKALDPYETDVGRLRSDEQLPQRVRPRSLIGRRDE